MFEMHNRTWLACKTAVDGSRSAGGFYLLFYTRVVPSLSRTDSGLFSKPLRTILARRCKIENQTMSEFPKSRFVHDISDAVSGIDRRIKGEIELQHENQPDYFVLLTGFSSKSHVLVFMM